MTLPYKFQCLYIGDGDQSFKSQADRLLQLLYDRPGSTDNTKSLLEKFKKEVEDMYSTSSAICNQEILIQFNESEYKVIPILDKHAKNRICYYALANIPASINTLAGFVARPLALQHVLEAHLHQYVSYIQVSTPDCSHWLWSLSIRDLPVYRILHANLIEGGLDYYTQFGAKFKDLILQNPILISILYPAETAETAETWKTEGSFELAERMYRLFKPCPEMAVNLALHVRTELQMKTLETLAQEDLSYRDAYRSLCRHKYGGYTPNSFKMIDGRVEKYGKEL